MRKAVPVVLEAGSPMSMPPSTLWLWGGPSKFLTVHFCYHIGKKIERWHPFSWVQIPLTKATVLRLSFPPKASSPKCITLEFPSFLTQGFHHATQTGFKTEDPPASASQSAAALVEAEKDTIAYCLWPSE